jgi:hypothetical protein
MEDLFVGLIAEIAGVLLEALLQIASELFVSLLVRRMTRVFDATLRLDPLVAGIGALLLGTLAGALTLVAFPHPLVPALKPSKLHGMSLILSPLLTGLVMSWIGGKIRRRGRTTMKIESFSYGFIFAFAMAIVQFSMAR